MVQTSLPQSAAPSQAPGSKAPLLELKGLHVEYPTGRADTRPVLRGIDLAVYPGEILGIVGESGAGKTVLARSILGVPPGDGRITAGEVRFRGQDILALPEPEQRRLRGRHLSVVVPNPRVELNPIVPIGRQLATMVQVHLGLGREAARAAALEMLRAVQIPDPERRMEAFAHELSGGMAQRVVIGMALICDPSFVISDDATSGLDVTVQAQVLLLMRRLVEEKGSAMLLITRDVGITAHHTDRTAVLYDGEIMELAPSEALFLRPAHPYTLMLLAAFTHDRALRDSWAVEATGARPPASGGCRYAARCTLATARCRETHPALQEIAPAHFVRCHHPVLPE